MSVQIPDVGVDVAAYVTESILSVGVFVSVCVGGYFGFMVIRKALLWSRYEEEGGIITRRLSDEEVFYSDYKTLSASDQARWRSLQDE